MKSDQNQMMRIFYSAWWYAVTNYMYYASLTVGDCDSDFCCDFIVSLHFFSAIQSEQFSVSLKIHCDSIGFYTNFIVIIVRIASQIAVAVAIAVAHCERTFKRIIRC